MTGAEAEREVRRQQREAARRSGPSTALLEAELWFSVLQHCQEMSASAVAAKFGDAIGTITGVKAERKQRALISAARKTKGNRLWLTTAGGFGDEAEQQMRAIAVEAQAEADEEYARRVKISKQGGGFTEAHATALELREAIVAETATGVNTQERLKTANAALIEAGFAPISRRSFYRMQKKMR